MLGLEPGISAEFEAYLLQKPAVYSGPSSCFISLSFYLSELSVTEAASYSPISILFPFIIVPLSFNWPYGCPVRDYISQPSLQLALALGLSSGQRGVNRSKACHFQVILVRGTGLTLSSCPSPFPLAGAQSWRWELKQSLQAQSWKSCSENGGAALPALVCSSLVLWTKQKYTSIFSKPLYLGVSLSQELRLYSN